MNAERTYEVIYLALVLAAFAIAGNADLREAERLSLEAYVNAHASVAPVTECR